MIKSVMKYAAFLNLYANFSKKLSKIWEFFIETSQVVWRIIKKQKKNLHFEKIRYTTFSVKANLNRLIISLGGSCEIENVPNGVESIFFRSFCRAYIRPCFFDIFFFTLTSDYFL